LKTEIYIFYAKNSSDLRRWICKGIFCQFFMKTSFLEHSHSFMHCCLRHCIDMISQLHIPAALTPRKGPFSRRFGESQIWPGRLREEKSYSSEKTINNPVYNTSLSLSLSLSAILPASVTLWLSYEEYLY